MVTVGVSLLVIAYSSLLFRGLNYTNGRCNEIEVDDLSLVELLPVPNTDNLSGKLFDALCIGIVLV